MKRLTLLSGFLMLLLPSCNKEKVTGSGTVTTEERTVAGFTAVHVSGATPVFITQGDHFEVKVKAYSNLLPYLETKLSNNTLTIGYKSNTSVKNDNSQVFITMPALTGLSLSGSSNITTSGDFTSIDNLNASVSGSGNISIESAEMNSLKINISGSGDVKSFGIIANEANVTISGSGDVEVTVNNKLDASISGSGDIYYKGTPATVNSNVSGSGKVIKK